MYKIMKTYPILLLAALSLAFSACKVDFSPNAKWKDVPVVYCVLDPQEDTVFARVQHCYLAEDNLYNYSQIFDSNNYAQGSIQVFLSAWNGSTSSTSITPNSVKVAEWELEYTLRNGKPDGAFSNSPQPVYYCVPGKNFLSANENCLYQLVVLNTQTHDTMAQAVTNMVGFRPIDLTTPADSEYILDSHNGYKGHHYGFKPVSRGELRWLTLPHARMYQPVVLFYYRKGHDTLSVRIEGTAVKDQRNSTKLSSYSINENRFLNTIAAALADNEDSLFNVNYVDIYIYACNEDLNSYITTRNLRLTSGQEYVPYTNVDGGQGIFGSRRTHLYHRVPCDSAGQAGNLPERLTRLGVGFYGDFGQNSR